MLEKIYIFPEFSRKKHCTCFFLAWGIVFELRIHKPELRFNKPLNLGTRRRENFIQFFAKRMFSVIVFVWVFVQQTLTF